MNSSSEESMSSEEPVSSEEPIYKEPEIYSKILWTTNSGWYSLTKNAQYPRPQGNLPMMQFLVPQKQQSLLNAYMSVRGVDAFYNSSEWSSYNG